MTAPIKLYQVTLNADGEAIAAIELPAEGEKNRTIFIRAKTEHKALSRAEDLFSLAK